MFVYMVCIQCVCMSFFLCGWLGWYAPNAVRGVCVRSRTQVQRTPATRCTTVFKCALPRWKFAQSIAVRAYNTQIHYKKGKENCMEKDGKTQQLLHKKKTQDCLLASIRFLIIAPWRIARSLPHHKQAEFPFFYSVADNFIKIIIASRKYTII